MDIVERVARAICRERMQHRNEIFREFEPHRYKTQEVIERMIDDSWGFEMDQAKATLSASGVAELGEALEVLLQAVCGETGFANAVRTESGICYPWPALDIAESAARAALARYRGEA